MTQKVILGALSGTGIVGVLFIIGFVLNITKIDPVLGGMALFAAVMFALVFGVLGSIGIVKKIFS